MSHKAEKQLTGGPFGIFQHPFWRKTPNKLEDPLRIFFPEKVAMPKKTEKGDPLVSSGIVCYTVNIFGSVPWANMGNLKFCRTVGRTILVTSGVSNNKPGTAQVGAISKAQKDSKTKTTFSTTGDNKSSQKTNKPGSAQVGAISKAQK